MSKVFDGGITSETIITPDAVAGGAGAGANISITPGAGDLIGVGGSVIINGGTGGATNANGGDVVLAGGAGGGSGTQGTITFDALGSSAPIPFNETGEVDLCADFSASSIIGALNELKGCVDASGGSESIYETATDLNYNGSTIQDVPGTVAVTTGNWFISYSLTFTTSSPIEAVAIFIRDGSNNIITESKTFIQDSSNVSRHAVSKQFIYTEALANNTLKISYQLNSGADTTVAIEMNPVNAGDPSVDQVPTLNVYQITGQFFQNAYTTITDINYNGTTAVAVPGTIVLPAGSDWIIGYSLAMSMPDTPDDVEVFVDISGVGTEVLSTTKWRDANSASKHTISRSWERNTAVPITLSLQFVLNSAGSTNAAIEMSALTGVADPDQVPVLWAFEVNGSDVQSGVDNTPRNYNGTTNVLMTGADLTLDPGLYMIGYSVALDAPSIEDNILTNIVRTSDGEESRISQAITQESNTNAIHSISRVFFYEQATGSSVIYNLSFRLGVETGVVNQAFDAVNQTAMIWSYRIGDVANGNTFLALTDTPSSYVGQGGKLLNVSNAEDGIVFSNISVSSSNNAGVEITSVSANVTGSPATSSVTVENSSLMLINNQLLLSATFSLTCNTPTDKTTFTFTLPGGANLTNAYDAVCSANGYVDTEDEQIANMYCIGVGGSNLATLSFTAYDSTNTHYLQAMVRYSGV